MDNYIGRKLDGRYEIKEIIGVGGMAVVYKAYDSIDDRTVAVKILKEEYLTNEEFRRRFKNESKAIAVLSHPNIVKVYDVSFGEKLQYIVMEFIDGITLKEYIDQQKLLTWKEAVHFTVQILRALQHAHEKGIVHRDIKPQNIMMLEDGTIKVTDFGIARFAHSETRTMTDKAIGSVHYISPEQARGGPTDEKSDIYSVGVMLFEMLTGKLPFEADSAVSVAIMQMQQVPSNPRAINPDIPEGLEDITLRAMQKDPTQRYKSASEMLSDIDDFKRNPSIHFEYKYFVDDNPTKYVDAINKIKDTGHIPEEDEMKEKKTHFIPILSGIAAALLLVALIALFAVMSLNGIFGSKTPNVTVPNLVGKTLDQAKAQYGSTIDIIQGTTTYSDKYAEGLICDQDQAAGTSVKKNSPVTVKISSGSKTVQIPSDIVNESQADAQTELTNLGFTNVKIASISSPDVAKGFVIKTDPAVGQKISTSTQITVYISTGPDQTALIAVPDLTGKTYAQAKAALEQAGLALGSVSPADTTVTSTGLVQSQNPTATTKVTRGSGVNITLALPVADSVDIDFTVPVKNTDNGYTITVSFDNKGIDSLSESQIYGPSTITITKGLSSGTKTIRIYAQAKDDTQPSQIKTVSFNFDTMTIVSQSDSQYNASPASSSPSSSSSSTSGH